ncbi:endo-type 6-aminohexanoate oligomer hydrolase [hydrothermal vent metagenome]|uniref:Endo-type 6-aminohexanoate oligomer hydrolase n=1 Tax=hydrothermal vent metagenome TaxID=652676 RepID=A0A3B0T6E6_9ZZZZ
MLDVLKGLGKGPKNLITDVEGLTVGNAQDMGALTGVTVVLADPPATAAVHIAGGAPGTRETDALAPESLVEAADAIVLSGGSVYGLDAASGVTAWLGARGRGFEIAGVATAAPIVPAAILFDLGNGGDKGWGETPPYSDLGKQAAAAASGDFCLGNAGAGLGATAGALKGGLGSASIATASGLTVGALVAANPVGSVVIPGTARLWAAPYEIDDEFGGHGWPEMPFPSVAADPFEGSKLGAMSAGANTTIAVIATNAKLTRTELRRVAIMAHDGLARAIRPVHTPFDGDTIFTLATGRRDLHGDRPVLVAALGALAADTLARAVARAVHEATSIGPHKALRDRHT